MLLLRRFQKVDLNLIRSSKDFSTLYMDPSLYNTLEKPTTSVGQFFSGPVSKTFSNMDTQDQVVMDMGCGPGNITTKSIVPLFPNLKKVLAVDILPNMIEFAKKNNSHPKVDYSVGDISQWSSVEKWGGEISNFFSIQVFHWLKDQKEGFRHVHQLLKPGGYAVFFFVLQSTFFDMCSEIESKSKWSEYLKDVNSSVPMSHTENYQPEYYADMVTEIGFKIEYYNGDMKTDVFASDSLYRDLFLIAHLKRNRRINGLPTQEGRMLELIARKI
ncbi:hypothetical protein JTE90_002610 [Oedothorax gibbosus]|uniref:Methyltransferase type 11 domain-containing protein n=1 Tax=Oedothorax gibbosus TaxID=931172 RepID=A0AAV6UCL0_9ARAC|nr:hypothetical protein JTE90_002610 [Oedothorax gibbosus]